MSKLSFIGRPWVVFDSTSEQHRQWFAEFQARHSWSHCPVRFVVDDDVGDLLTMIQRKLIDYYTHKEFGNRIKVLQLKVAKKPQKITTFCG